MTASATVTPGPSGTERPVPEGAAPEWKYWVIRVCHLGASMPASNLARIRRMNAGYMEARSGTGGGDYRHCYIQNKPRSWAVYSISTSLPISSYSLSDFNRLSHNSLVAPVHHG